MVVVFLHIFKYAKWKWKLKKNLCTNKHFRSTTEMMEAMTSRQQQGTYEPLPAGDSFGATEMVALNEDGKRFRVYRNAAEAAGSESAVVFVFHHGAGYSGLSAACLAGEVRAQGQGQYGFVSFDCRFHGASQVEQGADPAKPDLSLSTLAGDLVQLVGKLYPTPSTAPSLVLVGHSMGAAVVTEACAAIQLTGAKVLGLVLLDVVEGSALQALASMMPLISARPKSFRSPAECIKYHVQSHTIRNLQSARISVPSLIRNVSPPTRAELPADRAEEQEDTSAEPRFEWITDLRHSQPHWEGWFRGLSGKFLAQKTARLLVLAGTDRLDKELTIGQMQGKYQLEVLPNVGHCLHEDDPASLANILCSFVRRHHADDSAQILARLGKTPLPKK